MRGSQRTCGACGKAGPSWARFCGRCGELLADAGDAEPAPAEATGEDGQRAHRSRRGLVAVAGAVAVLGVTGILVFADADLSGGGDVEDEVALPDDDEATDPSQPSPTREPPATFGDVELECLVDSPCERWRTDVTDFGLRDPFGSVLEAGDDLLLVHGRRGVATMDEDGQWQWRRLLDDQEVTSAQPAGDDVLLATDDAQWHLLDMRDGTVRWSVQDEPEASEEHELAPIGALASGDLVLSLERGQVALDADEPPVMRAQVRNRHDGELLWERLDQAQLNLARGRVLVSDGERVHGLDALSGEPVWATAPPESEQEALPDHPEAVMGSLQVTFDGTAALVTGVPGPSGGEVLLLDTVTGEELAALDGMPLPAIDPRMLVLDAAPRPDAQTEPGTSSLQAVGRDGETRWSLDLDPLLDSTGPGSRSSGRTVHGGLLLEFEQGSQGEQRVRLVDLTDGAVVHEGDWDHGRPHRPLEPHIIEVADGDAVTAVTIAEGTPLWRLEGSQPHAAELPGATVFLDDGDLVAIEHDPRTAQTAS